MLVMKNLYIKLISGTVFFATLGLGSCSKILEEEPRSVFTPDFFKTEKGVIGGVTALYGHLRNIYGNGYDYNACLSGKDEYNYVWEAVGNFKDVDLSGVGSLTPSSSRSDVLWNEAFPAINTANGVIENAVEVEDISVAIVAEAYFFRGFDYFMLVQTF